MLSLEFWMSELPKPLTLIPIIELAIPGIYKYIFFNCYSYILNKLSD